MMFLILGIFVGIFILILVCFAIFYKQLHFQNICKSDENIIIFEKKYNNKKS